jgi:magnesium transporter
MTTDEPTKTHSDKAGMLPGTLLHIGERKVENVRITVIDYDEKTFQERQVENIDECIIFRATPTVSWINIDGLHEVEIIERIGECYDFHPLILEDIVTVGQRPKCDEYEDYIYIVMQMLTYNWRTESIESEQISMILGKNFLISFQETPGDIFDRIRERIRSAKGKIRKMPPDYLAYSLIDAIVDNYFIILERLNENIEDLEDKLVGEPDKKVARKILDLNRQLMFLRKSVWPLRELVSKLDRTESNLISKYTRPYLKDVYDHTIQVIESVQSLRDIMSVILEAYVTSISNRLNAIMKVLAVIATIFMPLSFVASLYGMNFRYMPEIEWKYGYVFALVIMAVITLVMLYYFKKKKWM